MNKYFDRDSQNFFGEKNPQKSIFALSCGNVVLKIMKALLVIASVLFIIAMASAVNAGAIPFPFGFLISSAVVVCYFVFGIKKRQDKNR